ncbi:MAG TPA: serine hydrolase [Armatimonadaceae bacterium]|nr:serine hydrolase [Armatimonadaceae bacterium]
MMHRVSGSLREELGAIEAILHGGNLGVAAADFASGETLLHNADWTFPTASVIKGPIVAALHAGAVEGTLSLDEAVEVLPEDVVAGSGVLGKLTPGVRLPLRDLALLAIMVSDNTASNLCLRAAGGPEAVNRRMHEEWEMPGTTIHRPIKFELTPDDPPHTATGTPQDMMRFMDAVARGTLHSDAVCDGVKELLATTIDSAMLPRYLEVNPHAADLRVARPHYTVLHKTGAVNGVRNDAGIIRRDTPPFGHIAICVYTKGVKDARWTPANAGCEAVSRVARLLVHRFWEKGDDRAPTPPSPPGADGAAS